MSRLIEDQMRGRLRAICKQFDPGPSAKYLPEVVRLVQTRLETSRVEGRYEEAEALEGMLDSLRPYLELADLKEGDVMGVPDLWWTVMAIGASVPFLAVVGIIAATANS